MISNIFLDELNQRLDFLSAQEKKRIIEYYEGQLMAAANADEEERLLEKFGDVDSIVLKYAREHEITEIASTSQTKISTVDATANLEDILAGDKESLEKTVKDMIIPKDEKEDKTKTFSGDTKKSYDGLLGTSDTILPDESFGSDSEDSYFEDEYVPSPEAEQTGFHPLIDDDEDFEQQTISLPAQKSIFAKVIKKFSISRSAAPLIFALMVIVLLPLFVAVCAAVAAVYITTLLAIIAVEIAVVIIALVFISIGVIGLINSIISIISSIPIGIIELGLATVAIAIAIAISALCYQFLFGIAAYVLKWLTALFKFIFVSIIEFFLGSSANSDSKVSN